MGEWSQAGVEKFEKKRLPRAIALWLPRPVYLTSCAPPGPRKVRSPGLGARGDGPLKSPPSFPWRTLSGPLVCLVRFPIVRLRTRMQAAQADEMGPNHAKPTMWGRDERFAVLQNCKQQVLQYQKHRCSSCELKTLHDKKITATRREIGVGGIFGGKPGSAHMWSQIRVCSPGHSSRP